MVSIASTPDTARQEQLPAKVTGIPFAAGEYIEFREPNAAGYGVQMTADLAQPQWTNVTVTPEIRDDRYVVLLSITNTQAFYRLAR